MNSRHQQNSAVGEVKIVLNARSNVKNKKHTEKNYYYLLLAAVGLSAVFTVALHKYIYIKDHEMQITSSCFLDKSGGQLSPAVKAVLQNTGRVQAIQANTLKIIPGCACYHRKKRGEKKTDEEEKKIATQCDHTLGLRARILRTISKVKSPVKTMFRISMV